MLTTPASPTSADLPAMKLVSPTIADPPAVDYANANRRLRLSLEQAWVKLEKRSAPVFAIATMGKGAGSWYLDPPRLVAMEASAGLVAASHNRNERVLIRGHDDPKPLCALSRQVCEICGDEVGLTVDGDLFVACNEWSLPVCRPCYEYECWEGTQNCPKCKTRYKRLKGTLQITTLKDQFLTT